jgi:DNA-binding phage protein
VTTLKVYKSYSFREKDPIIDRLRTVIADEGKGHGEIALESGVSPATLYNWFSGPTRRPTYACVAAVAATMGYRLTLTKGGAGASVITLRRGDPNRVARKS